VAWRLQGEANWIKMVLETKMFAIATAALIVLSAPATDGFSRASGVAEATAQGVNVHGAVCRLSATASPAPTQVRVEWRKASGEVVNSTTAGLIGGGLSGRGMGCNTYSASTAWRVNVDDLLVVAPVGVKTAPSR
jgi:hypothetical protein